MKPHEQRSALKSAAEWHARLGSEGASAEDRAAWHAWYARQPVNQWAWQRVEALQTQLHDLPASLAYRTLSATSPDLGRRSVLKGIALGLGVSTLAWTGYRVAPVYLADYRTRTGERRRLELADGTRLTLNTASAVDVRFGPGQRLVLLRAGEILVETGKDARPFIVRSAQGEMRALGTRFSARQHESRTELTVFEHAVAVRPNQCSEERTVQAKQTLSFDAASLYDVREAQAGQDSWSEGQLIFDDWPLHRVLAELQRYRPGLLGCAPEIAGLRLSGAYPLDDTDRALNAIARALPVRIERHTRYWVRLLPA